MWIECAHTGNGEEEEMPEGRGGERRSAVGELKFGDRTRSTSGFPLELGFGI